MIQLSICIPTFNRLELLSNCLNSILIASKQSDLSFEICISDNCSEENIDKILKLYENQLRIKVNKNNSNLGLGVNILKSVEIAQGQYCWIIGNDDLVLPETFIKLKEIFTKNKDVDFYYINSFHLNLDVIKKFPHPFDTSNLKTFKMEKFSKFNKELKKNFFDLVYPEVSFDFMLGMFLCIFKRKYWNENLSVIDNKLITDLKTYSSFDNTCPHIKIWAKAFNNRISFFYPDPLTINLSGQRGKEWGHLYPFIEAIRIPEVVDCYRLNGLPYIQYLYCKNFALRRFLPSIIKMLLRPKNSGLTFINFKKHILKNLFFPSIYVFPIFMILRKLYKIQKKIFKKK